MSASDQDLAGLPDDVREAVERVELIIGVSGDDLPIIRAELLRLARENAELRKHGQTMFLDARDWATRYGQQEARAECAEAELAALKRKIAEARRVMLLNRGKPDYGIESDTQCEIIDMCAALLPVGGEHER